MAKKKSNALGYLLLTGIVVGGGMLLFGGKKDETNTTPILPDHTAPPPTKTTIKKTTPAPAPTTVKKEPDYTEGQKLYANADSLSVYEFNDPETEYSSFRKDAYVGITIYANLNSEYNQDYLPIQLSDGHYGMVNKSDVYTIVQALSGMHHINHEFWR